MKGWVFVRLVAIGLGIVTLLGFASGHLGVEFKPFFASVLTVLQAIANLVVGAELWGMLLDLLRQHFTWVPKPGPHWKPIYTLSALLVLLWAQHKAVWYAYPIALVCALVPAVIAGTLPVGNFAVVMWPSVGIIATLAIFFALPPRRDWRPMLMVLIYTIGAVYYTLNEVDGTAMKVGNIEFLAFLVGVMGIGVLVIGLAEGPGTFWQRLQNPYAVMGLNITATLGGALFLGWLFAA